MSKADNVEGSNDEVSARVEPSRAGREGSPAETISSGAETTSSGRQVSLPTLLQAAVDSDSFPDPRIKILFDFMVVEWSQAGGNSESEDGPEPSRVDLANQRAREINDLGPAAQIEFLVKHVDLAKLNAIIEETVFF